MSALFEILHACLVITIVHITVLGDGEINPVSKPRFRIHLYKNICEIIFNSLRRFGIFLTPVSVKLKKLVTEIIAVYMQKININAGTEKCE